MSGPFVRTDAGRAQSRRPKQKSDCTVRTLGKLMGHEYDYIYHILSTWGRKCNRGWDIEGHFRKHTWLDGFGDTLYAVSQKMPYTKDHHEVGPAKRYRISNFLKDHPTGMFAVLSAKHVFAVMDGKMYDDLPWHFMEDRPVYAWLQFHPVILPLWQASAVRRGIKSGRPLMKRVVALVEGSSYKLAMRAASKQYEWALRTGEDLTVEPFNSN